MANPQFVKEFEKLCEKCLKKDGTPKAKASKTDLARLEELKEILAKDKSADYPAVQTASRTKKFPKFLNVCGNTIPVDDNGKAIGETDPRKRREILMRKKRAKRLGIDEERI